MTWFPLEQHQRMRHHWNLCASDGCMGIPTSRLEFDGVGSNYCSKCRVKIEKPGDDLWELRNTKLPRHHRDAEDAMVWAADQIERLRAREREALRLLNAAFGEYSCCGKAKLGESEVAEFERNFAVPARKFIAETKLSN